MTWFKRDKKSIEQTTPPEERRVRTEGLWTKCTGCRAIVWKKDLESNSRVCPKCHCPCQKMGGSHSDSALVGLPSGSSECHHIVCPCCGSTICYVCMKLVVDYSGDGYGDGYGDAGAEITRESAGRPSASLKY